jgi:hypothetical protein
VTTAQKMLLYFRPHCHGFDCIEVWISERVERKEKSERNQERVGGV